MNNAIKNTFIALFILVVMVAGGGVAFIWTRAPQRSAIDVTPKPSDQTGVPATATSKPASQSQPTDELPPLNDDSAYAALQSLVRGLTVKPQ